MNMVVLAGRLSGPPAEKVLESGTRLMSLQVTVESPGTRAESVPVAWFDPAAAAVELDEGDRVVVVGRVRRRFFRTPGGTQSRTEVVADMIVPASRPVGVRNALTEAVSRLADELDRTPQRATRQRQRTT